MILQVTVPTKEIFYTYWYGVGKILCEPKKLDNGNFLFEVDYGDDNYRAEYQAGRFHSGLYWAILV